MSWQRVIDANARVIEQSSGPGFVVIVSGTQEDRAFWKERATNLAADLFREDGRVRVASITEDIPRGNFLGTLDAWLQVRDDADLARSGLMTMVFGEGRRLSPFTQALGNRKPAFPTPAVSRSADVYLNAAELAMRHTASWTDAMNRGGFRGLLIKWGDEALVPEHEWPSFDFHRVDAIRFVSIVEPTETTAREKEWLVIDPATNEVLSELPRQDQESLLARIAEARAAGLQVGVNLGSLGASYDFLNVAGEVLRSALPENTRLDWDPFVWMALLCRTEEEWVQQSNLTGAAGDALRGIIARVPDFPVLLRGIRERLEKQTKRPFRVVACDFGEALWIDFGLHAAAWRALMMLVGDHGEASIARSLFMISELPDGRRNTIVQSEISPDANVTNSVVIGSTIGAGSTIRDAVIVGSTLGSADIRAGGAILFTEASCVHVRAGRAIVFGWRGQSLDVAEGDRVAMVQSESGPVEVRSNESLAQYDEAAFSQKVFGNRISFAEATALARRFGPAYSAQQLRRR